MNEKKFPYEDHILTLEEGEKEVIFIKGKPFIIQPATDSDIERVGKGCFLFGD